MRGFPGCRTDSDSRCVCFCSTAPGLENYYDNPRFFDLLRRETATDPSYAPKFETLIEFVADRPPLFPPGEGFKYTDVGYLLIGLAIEQATGRPYYETARVLLLDPLGLNLNVAFERPSTAGTYPGICERSKCTVAGTEDAWRGRPADLQPID